MTKITPDDWEAEQVARHRSQTDKHADHKDPRKCPICSSDLERTGEGGRFKNQCGHCHAVLATELVCEQCQTRRVWRGSLGIACHGCGHAYEGPAAGSEPAQ